jgi:hypothetical protein
MTTFLARLTLAMLIGSAALIGVGGASAAATPTIAPARVAGSYVFHTKFGTSSYSKRTIKLLANHTGSDGIAGDTLTWKTKGRKITIIGKSPTVTATFLGSVTSAGFNSVQHPGTITNSIGETGNWYAVKTT